MNIQEIERREGLIKKARDILERIEELKERINKVKGCLFGHIVIYFGIEESSFSMSDWSSKQRSNDYNDEVEAYMINAFIDITKAEIARLERELAELWIWG
ncbi:hypothetical protein [Brevibacillus laterosporus]|uniref:hypothetical protein n=1 Tax=Brevibacillus laterosporus TaxID=1465 RepID=UPI00264E1129|nr:hypothetical protein [Brevibacillus laterosporus]MDN9011074.1 hypothetical protein [Brevibacillus laterosporus]MDO0942097.1 hypothetical protein [Brevibacillus laterosporus]